MPISRIDTRGLPLGLAGATAATRYVGATASGAPATGAFAVGDFVIDQTGAVYVCTAAGSPGTWAAVGGGLTTGQEALEGNATSINNGSNANLPFNTKDSGDTLLDITTPAAPKIINAGLYVIQFTVAASALTAGGGYTVVASVGAGTFGATCTAGTPDLYCGLTCPVKATANAAITVNVTNRDGVSARNFNIALATVVRFS